MSATKALIYNKEFNKVPLELKKKSIHLFITADLYFKPIFLIFKQLDSIGTRLFLTIIKLGVDNIYITKF